MSTTLNDMVRYRLMEEGPTFDGELDKAARYVDQQLDAMTNTELLQYISDALQRATQMPVRPWL